VLQCFHLLRRRLRFLRCRYGAIEVSRIFEKADLSRRLGKIPCELFNISNVVDELVEIVIFFLFFNFFLEIFFLLFFH
jgi:hypothetical protein